MICEALACGRAVLTSNVCDNPLWITHGENGFLFDPGDPNSIAKAMLDFINLDPAARSAVGKKARIHAEKELHEDVFLERYMNVINHVASKY